MTKHRKASLTAVSVLIVCCLPIYYLAGLHKNNVELDVSGFGQVPAEFALMFRNNQIGMTRSDTLVHHTVIVVAERGCKGSCKRLFDEMNTLKDFYNLNLKGDLSDPNTPTPARFIIQSAETWERIPEGWDLAVMASNTPYLIPERAQQISEPAFVLVDDNGYYRGVVSLNDSNLQEKLQTELKRMVSEKFLMHYVDRQALMWKKARGKK